jgi:hypothetical protein
MAEARFWQAATVLRGASADKTALIGGCPGSWCSPALAVQEWRQGQ